MKNKKFFKNIKKNGKTVLEYYLSFKEKNNSLDSMKKTRDEFPQLMLIEAKEVMIICDTEYDSLDSYQESLLDDIEQIKKE